ncbi:MAG: hypothetical protein QF682_00475 [Candidatus Thermoplasmatota archaeon]|nr:hypothetical protein [Candidatus Thermoplasmatota archaeon]
MKKKSSLVTDGSLAITIVFVMLNMSLNTGSVYFHNLSIYLYNSTTEDFDLPIIKCLYNATYKEKSLAVENLDDDYECKIIVAYDNITVLNWDGSDWIEPTYSPFGSSKTHVDIGVGDMNNDSYQDVVTITDLASTGVAVFLWNETNNNFDAPNYYSTGAIPSKLFIDDVNDDGRDDIIVKYDSSTDYISIFNQSDSGFDTRYDMEFSGDIIANSLIVDDIDGDDKNDIVLEVERETPYYGNYLVYRLWNSTSSGFDDDEFFNTSLGYYSDLAYFDINNDGEKEIIGTGFIYGEPMEIYNITDLTLLMINSISNTQTHPSFIEYGNLNHDSFTDMICYETGGQGSVLYWNGSTSNTTRSLVVDVRNDTDVGVQGATVKIYDADDKELFNLTTNATGITPTAQVRLMEKDISVADYFGPFKVNITKLSGGTWYNVTRYFNLTTDEGIYTITKYIGNDTDNDGLTDGEEVYVIGTNFSRNDTDGDSILDGTEYGINDTTKPSTTGVGFVADEDSVNVTSPLGNDTDGDGLLDNVEDDDCDGKQDAGETDPSDWDSDGDNLPDGWIDYDYDDVKDLGEYEDYDLDGIVDGGAWGAGGEPDPLDNDTDNDGSDDRLEVYAGYDPLDNTDVAPTLDSDGDMLEDVIETLNSTDPYNVDTDGDGLWDGFIDSNGNGLYDYGTDVGEDINRNGFFDQGETNPENRDTDDDGVTDDLERTTYEFMIEAENILDNDWWFNDVGDPLANRRQGSQTSAVLPKPDGKNEGDFFTDYIFALNFDPTKEYQLFCKFRLPEHYLPAGDTFSIKITINDIEFIHVICLKDWYRWFSFPDFGGINGDLTLSIGVIPNAGQWDAILLDKLCIKEHTEYRELIDLTKKNDPDDFSPHYYTILDPNNEDIDSDELNDGLDSNTNCFWIEPEDLDGIEGVDKGFITFKSGASNSYGVIAGLPPRRVLEDPLLGGRELQQRLFPRLLQFELKIDEATEILLHVRAGIYSGSVSGNLKISLNKDEFLFTTEIIVEETSLNWYKKVISLSDPGIYLISIDYNNFVGHSMIFLDKVMIQDLSDIDYFENPNYISEPWRQEIVSSSIDPDSDWDGLIDYDESHFALRTNWDDAIGTIGIDKWISLNLDGPSLGNKVITKKYSRIIISVELDDTKPGDNDGVPGNDYYRHYIGEMSNIYLTHENVLLAPFYSWKGNDILFAFDGNSLKHANNIDIYIRESWGDYKRRVYCFEDVMNNPYGLDTSPVNTPSIYDLYLTSNLDGDSDNDRVSDFYEYHNGREITIPFMIDSDDDGLTDYDELEIWGTNPLNQDTDGDGLWDAFEVKFNFDKTRRRIQHLNPLKGEDRDGDGLKDSEEVFDYDTNPFNKDTDGDRVPDGEKWGPKDTGDTIEIDGDPNTDFGACRGYAAKVKKSDLQVYIAINTIGKALVYHMIQQTF